ncbi:hypothetical protein niasHT_004313 [Heterodera trifolii]|uniref:Uncharacterized protein n=1 Tax=Heterodera trifolii TaxID=157864 RepID=A0ABD2LQY9_9BILA
MSNDPQSTSSDADGPEMPDERQLWLEMFESGDYELLGWFGRDRAKQIMEDLRKFAEETGRECTHVKMILDKINRGMINWKKEGE